jgi:hypothetical protein
VATRTAFRSLLDADTRDILYNLLGYSDEQIAAFEDAKVLA